MKRKLLIVLVLLLSLIYACQQKYFEEKHFEEKTWISSNWTETLEPRQYKKYKEIMKSKERYKHFVLSDTIPIRPVPKNLILKFKKDSLILFHYERHDFSTEQKKQSLAYTYRKDSIIITHNKEEGVAFKIEQLRKEKLIVSSYLKPISFLDPLNTITFQPLKKFPGKKSIEAIESFLAKNKFLINNTETEIFFEKPSIYGGGITLNKSNKSLDLKSRDNWYLIEVDNELFLAVGAELIQIVALQKDKMHGYIYGEKNREISIERIAPLNE